MRPHRNSLYASLLLVSLMVFGTLGFAYSKPEERTYPDPVPLRISGLIGDSSGGVHPVPPEEARGAEYLPNSNVLRLPNGELMYLPEGAKSPVTVPSGDPGALGSARDSRAWLSEGEVPGESDLEREVASRALLDLRLLTDSDGASIAAFDDRWDYVWPRDASWVSAAFAATGHYEESYEALNFLSRTQSEDGTWEARYYENGEPVEDGRAYQLDASGWFPWAVWFHAEEGGRGARELWPAVERAADASVDSLGVSGLPPGGADYWEIRTMRPNLGTSAALLVGLRSSSKLAKDLGYDKEAARYDEAAQRLGAAIERYFAPNGYTRTTWPGSGRDAAVTFLSPPFAAADEEVMRELRRTESVLTAPNGGIVPGEKWPQEPTVSWSAETAFFMLSAAASGDEERADHWLGWLAAHRTELGAFPEKIDADGSPKAAAPLGWTDAAVLLALSASEDSLPVPPE